jgi:hypothetical protein
MSFFRRISGRERRSGKDRRVFSDPSYSGPLRRSGIDRRGDQAQKGDLRRPKSQYDELSGNRKKVVNRIINSLEKQGKRKK